MEKLFRAIIRHRKIILALAALALVFTGVSALHTRLNSDVARYLPDDSSSKQTITILREDFGINGDAEICAEGGAANYAELNALAGKISALDEVAEVQWLGSYEGLFAFDGSRLVSAEALLPDENVQNVLKNLYFEFEGKNYYAMTISLTAANATAEAGDALEKISGIMEGYSLPYQLGGTAVQSNDMLKSALGELPKFIIVAAVVILVILLLSASSVTSAIVILFTIGISIIYNLGTNFFTADVSTVTFSVAAVLQLALSMDYSIFLTHAFEKARENSDDETAMITALKKTFAVIVASALTTVAGFCALFAMKYTMGFDMGLCLAKGVSLSFLAVIIVQPCLMLCLKRAADKTKHRTIEPPLKSLARLPKKLRILAPLLVILLIVPSFLLSNTLDYYYLDSGYEETAVGPKGAAQSLGTQSVFVAETVSAGAQLSLAEKIENLDTVTGVTGYYALVRSLTRGLRIPVYSSLTQQDENTLMFTLEPSPEAFLAAFEGDREPLEKAVTAQITLYASKTVPALVIEALANEAAALGRPLTPQEQQAISERVTAEQGAKLEALVTAQLSAFDAKLAPFMEQFGSYRGRFFADLDGTEYTLLTVKISGQPEGEKALDAVKMIGYTVRYVLGTDAVYASGNTQSVSDLASTTARDLYIVNILSAVLILIILLFTFKEVVLSLLLIVLIELAIFINLSISRLMGHPLNFMSYIVISAIQLGATIDYAILMAKTYRAELGSGLAPYRAIASAIHQCAFPIMISMSILCGACISVYLISSDAIIREITMLISRGSLISGLTVLFILPAILPLMHKRKIVK